jgi:hypothetical protein
MSSTSHYYYLPARRHTPRVETREGVWAYWRCSGRDDVSQIHDLSLGGAFLRTPASKPVGTTVNLHFLVEEGQVRADAIVRHMKPGHGLGLEFTAVSEEDLPQLAALVTRFRSPSASR